MNRYELECHFCRAVIVTPHKFNNCPRCGHWIAVGMQDRRVECELNVKDRKNKDLSLESRGKRRILEQSGE